MGDLDELVGQEFDFYGVDNHHFKLDTMVFEAREDESDGYRSMLDCVTLRPSLDVAHLIFFGAPVARVRVEAVENFTGEGLDSFTGYRLCDATTGHCWLAAGTDESDDCYPSFVFAYAPDPSRTVPSGDAPPAKASAPRDGGADVNKPFGASAMAVGAAAALLGFLMASYAAHPPSGSAPDADAPRATEPTGEQALDAARQVLAEIVDVRRTLDDVLTDAHSSSVDRQLAVTQNAVAAAHRALTVAYANADVVVDGVRALLTEAVRLRARVADLEGAYREAVDDLRGAARRAERRQATTAETIARFPDEPATK